MSDLREKLARRLANLTVARVGDKEPWDQGTMGQYSRDFFYKMADECLRQMEWASRNGFDSCCNRGLLSQDLTPAPDDWTPTKE